MTFLQHVIEALSLGGLYALFALSIALVFGVANIINFAQGEIIAVGAYVLLIMAGVPWPVAVIATLAAAVVVSNLVEVAAFRPVRGADATTLLVVGFGVSVLIQSLLLIFAGARAKTTDFAADLGQMVHLGSIEVSYLSLLTIALAALLIGALTVLLRRTQIGVQLRAAAADLRMARLLGVRTNVVVGVAFGISGLLAGTAAILLVAQSGTLSPGMGLEPLLIAFVATVIGGIGSIYGAALGGLLLGSATIALQNLLPVSLGPYRDAFLFLLVIVVLLVRPQGIMSGSKNTERI